MSVGGVGFQVTSYVVGAERGYITKAEASSRVVDILRVTCPDFLLVVL